MVKPRAARKKPVVLSSDSEQDETHSPPPKRTRRGTLTSSSNGPQGEVKPARAQTLQAPLPKPSKAALKKSPAKSPTKPKPGYKPITSFFSHVPRSQSLQPTPSPEKPGTPFEDVDDIFDSSDDDHTPKPTAALPLRKNVKPVTAAENDHVAKSRQQFLRTTSGARSTPPASQPAREDTVDRRPWTERYGPLSLEELAVHKKKVADIRTWLTDVFGGRERKRLLLLKGPAGSGKTTTMSLLARELSIGIQEWKNPTGSMSTSDSFVSVTAQFEDFVGRTGTFGSLTFDTPVQAPQQASPSGQTGRQKQLVLVEEFPNTFTRTSSAVQSFRSSVLNYLAANTQSATMFFSSQVDPEQSVTPIVMIISETLLSTNTAAADSFTAHRLLGPEILTHPGVSVIEFNPIAPTYMTKALDMIVVKEARKSGRKKTLGPQVIQRLAELGDIRSAVSSLEFLCLRGDDAEGWGAKVNFSKKKGPKDTPITKMEQESLELVTQRESTLGIFHAVGRVVYNKRLSEDTGAPVPQPPNWFPERRRPKASEVNVDLLIDEIGTDTQTFVAALHENYVLSCGGADTEETMDSIEGCIEALSNADLLSPDRFGAGSGRRSLQGTSADNLRQDEMCFQTSVRGLLYNLPHPVKRVTPPPGIMGIKAKGQGAGTGAPKGNAFVMYYPASLRLWKQQEEVGGLLEMWISRAQKGELLASTAAAFKPTISTGGVDTWRKNTSFSQRPSTQNTKPSVEDTSSSILLGSGGSARYEMLLERLPYLTTILRKSRMLSPSTAATIRDIQKITAFTGNTASGVTEDDEQEEDPRSGEHEQWATDRPAAETPKKKRGIKVASTEPEQESAIPGLIDKGASLMLSDDDIED
ncbi:cell cycle checkpoint protein RAD17 [Cucurbitaria berberidis CBS 394.84]|uniref:Cell cycle checkpoint protein RAD17 n=1 Tax=Cucurbitaria berberidis CBS 394.84 TaxID=1168544 RepID=A0A9P4L371_9PLEO|nr:cell cycle checkpoint protein RAD17 [Cucurbitaria berberidis CBS 394.84]KAF1839977.1 cell cycle checkpoint protein RAD17 [Cucurbitaria berberidis CBS 394.84]